MPNPTEMGRLLDLDREAVARDPRDTLERALELANACFALRGTTTWIGARGSACYVERNGHPGLGTAGSGDVLAGIIAGFLAGGAEALTATIWGVHAHAQTAHRVAESERACGFLARELLQELPATIEHLRHPPRLSRWRSTPRHRTLP
jgi:NAD(P)H-hydrate repair Nnr-like enzyme with NAD(P)H-hydrate dehydratase domain